LGDGLGDATGDALKAICFSRNAAMFVILKFINCCELRLKCS
jgi:hypothetical protein